MNKDSLKLLFSASAARLIERGITCYVSFFENDEMQISARFAKASVYMLCDKDGPSVRMYSNPDKVHPTESFDSVDEALQRFWSLVRQYYKGAL